MQATQWPATVPSARSSSARGFAAILGGLALAGALALGTALAQPAARPVPAAGVGPVGPSVTFGEHAGAERVTSAGRSHIAR